MAEGKLPIAHEEPWNCSTVKLFCFAHISWIFCFLLFPKAFSQENMTFDHFAIEILLEVKLLYLQNQSPPEKCQLFFSITGMAENGKSTRMQLQVPCVTNQERKRRGGEAAFSIFQRSRYSKNAMMWHLWNLLPSSWFWNTSWMSLLMQNVDEMQFVSLHHESLHPRTNLNDSSGNQPSNVAAKIMRASLAASYWEMDKLFG